ncbi:unnamed protein product [Arctogadus glacialis]
MEEQRRRAIEGVVDITKLCLMEMNQQELADTLRGGMVSATTSGSELFMSHLSGCVQLPSLHTMWTQLLQNLYYKVLG